MTNRQSITIEIAQMGEVWVGCNIERGVSVMGKTAADALKGCADAVATHLPREADKEEYAPVHAVVYSPEEEEDDREPPGTPQYGKGYIEQDPPGYNGKPFPRDPTGFLSRDPKLI